MCASSNSLTRLSHRGIRTYTVLVRVGETLTPLVLGTLHDLMVNVYYPPTLTPDTGSSDLWVLSSSCATDCFSATVPLYPQTAFQPSGLAIRLEYGNSLTGTFAQGAVGKDLAGIAGFQLRDQYLAAISETNTGVLQRGSAGIFGLGFPVNRCASDFLCWSSVFHDYTTGVGSHFASF